MTSYRTMTVGGSYGSTYLAMSWDEAERLAEADGYIVLDYTDGNVLVVAG